MSNIPLGFELGTGKLVNIPLRHTAVTGQTQESGKTTTLEAMITRSGLRAVCFITKKGEGSFTTGRSIMPYFKESADWQFVESILEATMREGMKFNRSWIIKLCGAYHGKDGMAPQGLAEKLQTGCDYPQAMKAVAPDHAAKHSTLDTPKGAFKLRDFGWPKPKTLEDVALNVEIAILKARGLSEGVYTELREYLRIVVPQIKSLPKTDSVDLKPGVNVMWLDEYSMEMQALIIRSVLEWITDNETRTVTVIPEAAMLLPQQRSSPVLLAAEKLVRQGAANNNWIWLDSQDIAGVNKVMLRQCGVWILGRQREIHEAERTLDHLPGGVHKPKLDEVMKLGKGQFFVAYGDDIRKTYVWPVWLTADEASVVAYTQSAAPAAPAKSARNNREDDMWRERAQKAEERVCKLEAEIERMKADIKTLGVTSQVQTFPGATRIVSPQPLALNPSDGIPEFSPVNIEKADTWLRDVWPLCRDSVAKDPAIISVVSRFPEIEILRKREKIELHGQALRGRLAKMIADGFFDAGAQLAECSLHLNSIGQGTANKQLSRELGVLTSMGFLVKNGNTNQTQYKRVPGLRVSTRTIESA
jgi:hypothetical protein